MRLIRPKNSNYDHAYLLPWIGWILALSLLLRDIATIVFIRVQFQYGEGETGSGNMYAPGIGTIWKPIFSSSSVSLRRHNGTDWRGGSGQACGREYHTIGGVYPDCIPILDLKDPTTRNHTAVWHMLAYGGDKFLGESYDNARRLARMWPRYDIMITVDDTNTTRDRTELYSRRWEEEFPTGPLLYYIAISQEEFDAPVNMTISTDYASANYKRMNRWRIRTQFEQLAEMWPSGYYDYVIQLDSNLLVKDMPCDPIQVMVRSRSLFGYYNAGIEQRHLVSDFDSRFHHYVERNGLTYSGSENTPSTSGGFLIFDVRLFTSRSYMHFANFVDSTNLIFSHRLTDQNIFPYAMKLLTQGRYMHKFSGFKFEHVGAWGGEDVYTDRHHPLWHRNGSDPFCVAVADPVDDDDPSPSGREASYDELREEMFWTDQMDARHKNSRLVECLEKL